MSASRWWFGLGVEVATGELGGSGSGGSNLRIRGSASAARPGSAAGGRPGGAGLEALGSAAPEPAAAALPYYCRCAKTETGGFESRPPISPWLRHVFSENLKAASHSPGGRKDIRGSGEPRKEGVMRVGLRAEHWVDVDGNPAGGNTFGQGFAIGWQNGPLGRGGERLEPNGAFVEDVIDACADRIRFYQGSRFACDRNARALAHLEVALEELDARTREREAAGIEGTHEVGWARDDESTQIVLHLACVGVELAEIAGWDDEMCQEAEAWAGAVHLRASDNDVEIPPVPAFLASRTS